MTQQRLWALRDAVAGKLQEIRLTLHDDKTQIYRTTERVDVLGYKVSRYRRRLRNDNGFRFQRRLKHMSQYVSGRTDRLADPECLGTELDWPCPPCRDSGVAGGDSQPGEFQQGSGPERSQRVIRGGAWNNNPRNLRSANRNRNTRSNRNNNIGFRLAQSARCPEWPFSWKWPVWQTGVHEPASGSGREARANSAVGKIRPRRVA